MARKFVIMFTVCCMCLFCTSVAWGADSASGAAELETTAKSAILMEAASGNILWSKEADLELPMASVTKIMTLLLAFEAMEQGQISYDDTVTASENAWKMGGSQIYLESGEQMSMKDMLIAVAVGSANDASVAVAEHLAGSEEAFVAMMNQKARDLGCRHTNFINSTGLPAENHHTSARDMAVILQEAIKYPEFMKTSSIYSYDLRGGDFVLWSTNKLLKWYTDVDAGKTGWTNEASYCLAATAQRDGLRLISVVLGTSEPRSHFRETIKVFNYGFARYEAVSWATKNQKVATLNVSKGTQDQVNVIARDDVTMAIPKGKKDSYQGQMELPEQIIAPVAQGQTVGHYLILQDNQEMQRIPLVAQSQVEKASVFLQIRKVLDNTLGW